MIRTWKTAGALVRLNGIATVNTHSAPEEYEGSFPFIISQIRTRWYTLLRSRLVNKEGPWREVKAESMSDNGYLFSNVI